MRWYRQVGVGLALLVVGCASTDYIVAAGQPSNRAPDEGLLAFVFDSDYDVGLVEVSQRDGSWRGNIEGVDRGQSIHLLRLPPGVYCIDQIMLGDSVNDLERGDICARVIAGRTTYGGHVLFKEGHEEGAFSTFTYRLVMRWEDYRQRHRWRWPNIEPARPLEPDDDM